MKTIRIFSIIVFTTIFLGAISLIAQPAPHERQGMDKRMGKHTENPMFSKLTDEQKTKIKEIKIAAMKEAKPLHNQLGELRAKQKTLTTADKPDMTAINANIDEIAKVTGQLMKIQVAAHQKVRALLTDEQKLMFDMHNGKKDGKWADFKNDRPWMKRHFQAQKSEQAPGV